MMGRWGGVAGWWLSVGDVLDGKGQGMAGWQVRGAGRATERRGGAWIGAVHVLYVRPPQAIWEALDKVKVRALALLPLPAGMAPLSAVCHVCAPVSRGVRHQPRMCARTHEAGRRVLPPH